MKLKKIVMLLTAGVLLMNTIPCYAASGASVKTSVSSSSGDDGAKYAQIPDAETLQKDVGFVPKSPDTLAGDFKFTSGIITESYNVQLAVQNSWRFWQLTLLYSLRFCAGCSD